jgi:hypothetical protein
MNDWAKAVLAERGIERTYPVAAAPNKKNARSLQSRMRMLKKLVIPAARHYIRTVKMTSA